MKKTLIVLMVLMVLLSTFITPAAAKKETYMIVSYINGEYLLDPVTGLNLFTARAFVVGGDHQPVAGAMVKFRLTLIFDDVPETRIVWVETDADGFATIESLTEADVFYLVVSNVISKDYTYLPGESVTLCVIQAFP